MPKKHKFINDRFGLMIDLPPRNNFGAEET